jgi:hypothetical protein
MAMTTRLPLTIAHSNAVVAVVEVTGLVEAMESTVGNTDLAVVTDHAVETVKTVAAAEVVEAEDEVAMKIAQRPLLPELRMKISTQLSHKREELSAEKVDTTTMLVDTAHATLSTLTLERLAKKLTHSTGNLALALAKRT